MISYPMTTGRNFHEVLRVIDSLQLTANHKVATPANWEPGEDVIIAGSVSDEDAKKAYPWMARAEAVSPFRSSARRLTDILGGQSDATQAVLSELPAHART